MFWSPQLAFWKAGSRVFHSRDRAIIENVSQKTKICRLRHTQFAVCDERERLNYHCRSTKKLWKREWNVSQYNNHQRTSHETEQMF